MIGGQLERTRDQKEDRDAIENFSKKKKEKRKRKRKKKKEKKKERKRK